jgi:hypothetical protein
MPCRGSLFTRALPAGEMRESSPPSATQRDPVPTVNRWPGSSGRERRSASGGRKVRRLAPATQLDPDCEQRRRVRSELLLARRTEGNEEAAYWPRSIPARDHVPRLTDRPTGRHPEERSSALASPCPLFPLSATSTLRPRGRLRTMCEGVAERLARSSVRDRNGCLVWTGSRTTTGYGKIGIGGKTRRVHRVAWELQHGAIPDALVTDHLCRVRLCIEVSHLELVPNRVNILRGVGPTAQKARQQSCRRGHQFSAENTRITRDNRRRCRQCHRESQRRTRGAA